MEELVEFPAPGFSPCPAPARVGIWKVNLLMEALLQSLSLSPHQTLTNLNKNKIKKTPNNVSTVNSFVQKETVKNLCTENCIRARRGSEKRERERTMAEWPKCF